MVTFIISLLICIILHELGHLLAAKIVKCGVDIFSVGFGRAIFKKKIGSTIYQIAWIPLGGYCKLKDELVNNKDKDSFTNLSYRNKLIIVLAGCVVNIIIGQLSILIGTHFLIFNLIYAGYISLFSGIINLLPIPALDGSYPFLVLLEKKLGKEKGYSLMEKICSIGFKIIMIINILCIPWLIKNWRSF